MFPNISWSPNIPWWPPLNSWSPQASPGCLHDLPLPTSAPSPVSQQEWSEELAQLAVARVAGCLEGPAPPPAPQLGWSEALLPVGAGGFVELLERWFAEGRRYDYGAARCAGNATCRHYTQVGWGPGGAGGGQEVAEGDGALSRSWCGPLHGGWAAAGSCVPGAGAAARPLPAPTHLGKGAWPTGGGVALSTSGRGLSQWTWLCAEWAGGCDEWAWLCAMSAWVRPMGAGSCHEWAGLHRVGGAQPKGRGLFPRRGGAYAE